jgi:adenylate cyclase
MIVWKGQGAANDQPLRLAEAYADERFISDPYGTWLSAYAPIYGAAGEIVAMVGVDIAADALVAKWDQVRDRSLAALGIAVAIAGLLSVIFSRVITRPIAEIAAAVQRIGSGHLETRIPVSRRSEFGLLAENINEMAESLQERDALKGALSRYVSHDAARRLIEEKLLPELRGERRDVTVMIGDITNLDRVAEEFPPERLVELLNEYFEKMVEIIFHHNGTIDRLLGSGLIAVFGAPIADDKKERNALNAAIEMHREQAELNSRWALEGDQRFRLSIGIHTGSAVLGNIGSKGNIEFTVLGSSVDIAALIVSKNQDFKTGTLVSETTVEAVRGEFGFDEAGDVQPYDLSDFIRLYSVRQLTPTTELKPEPDNKKI